MSHHHHDHPEEKTADLSFQERLTKLFDHWVKHNMDHADTYREWAAKAEKEQLTQVATLLEDAARMTLEISETIQEAARIVRRHPES